MIRWTLRPPRFAAALAGALLLTGTAGLNPAPAQQSSQEWLNRCSEQGRSNGGRATYCELREATLAAPARLEVSARPNGGIEVTGSDRSDVHVTARVQTWAESESQARELAQQVQIETGNGRIAANGPTLRGTRNRGWSVSYVVSAPRRIDLELATVNGGVQVTDVAGDLTLTTTNGGIRMGGVGGRVRARTTNGGVDVRLAGDRWAGDGLDLQTTNGAIALIVPAGFAADLSARTVNGGIHTDFPVTVQGRIGRNLEAEIGGGGPPVRLSTTNGGIEIRRN